MRKVRSLLLIGFIGVIVLLPAICLHAQPIEIPLAEGLEIARQQSLEVVVAEANAKIEQAELSRLRADRWPSLSLSLNGGQRFGLGFDQTTGELTQQSVEVAGANLSANVTLFDGFEGRARRRAAEAAVRAAELDVSRAERLAQEAVLTAYQEIAQAEAVRQSAEATVEAQERIFEIVNARVQAGESPRVERDRQRGSLAEARAAALDADHAVDVAHARLVRLLGLDPTKDYTFPANLDEPTAPLAADSALIALGLFQRDDVQSADLAVQAGEAGRRAEKASRFPTLRLGASVGTDFTSANEDIAFFDQLEDNRRARWGLTLSFPIFDKGVTDAAVRRAEAQAVRLEAEAVDLRRAVTLEVQEARLAAAHWDARLELAEKRFASAQSAAEISEAAYAAGASTLDAVALTQSDFAAARSQAAQARVVAAFARLFLDLAVGNPIRYQ